jgi:putative FmdB family regulatory protein
LPLYEYKCVKCRHRFEKIESHTAGETKKCPKCGAKAERQLSAPAIQFKGSGWYVTDYGGKSGGAPSGEGSGDGGPVKAGEKGNDAKSSGDKGEKNEKSEKSEKSDKGEKNDKSEKGTGKKKK